MRTRLPALRSRISAARSRVVVHHVGAGDAQWRLQRGLRQRGLDHAAPFEQAHVGVGERTQPRFAAAEEVGRAALRDEQAQHATERQALCRPRRRIAAHLFRREAQRPVAGIDVGAIPGMQPVEHAVDLAEAAHRAERQPIDVVEQNAAACKVGVGAVTVRAHRGRDELQILLLHIGGPALGRMPELLELGGQGAATGGRVVGIHRRAQLVEHRAAQPVPLDRRVVGGRWWIEHFAVLDEGKRTHDQRRNRLRIGVDVHRIAAAVQRIAAAIVDLEAGLVLLHIRWVEAPAQIVHQFRALACLCRDRVMAGAQPLDEVGDAGVAEPLIVGPRLRIAIA